MRLLYIGIVRRPLYIRFGLRVFTYGIDLPLRGASPYLLSWTIIALTRFLRMQIDQKDLL